ncbi:retinoic acid receptor responder protein 1 isoform X1 [Erinaceus europaeus]|uniref:Retinoic acid receptor responder protein 1 isoform X1 n=1 Tax=Erinaceus europaeus TaxID=9365 RepID=A0ABM3XXM3_ERIEU|nr:retinoic acid receptor responder protein 1 isoform X1 [Erinaceus europaeus]
MEPRGSPHPFAPLCVLLLQLLLFALRDAAQIQPSNVSDWVQRVKQPEYQKWLALTALHYFNYRSASPTTLRLLHTVTSSTGFVNREKKFAAGVAFTAGAYHMTKEKKYTGNCLTSVTFKSKVLAPDVIVSCQVLMNKLKGERDDHLLFKNLSKTLPIPGQVVAIPASKENMNTSLVPILDLALLGSSYVMWNRTTLSSYFSFERLSAVSHWEVKDEEVHFDYLALIRELSTQEIVPCLVHMIWYPIKTLKIEYHCSDIQKKQH